MQHRQPGMDLEHLPGEWIYGDWCNIVDTLGHLTVKATVSLGSLTQRMSDSAVVSLEVAGEWARRRYALAEIESRRLASKKSTKISALAATVIILSSPANTDSEGTPVVCLDHSTPPIASEALDPAQPENPESGLRLRVELKDRPTSDDELQDDHKDNHTLTNHPERTYNPIRAVETMSTLLGLDTVHETELPRSGLVVRVHTTKDWLVDMSGLENFLFSGVENADFIPHPTMRKVLDCYGDRALNQGVMSGKIWNIYLTPQPGDCFEDLGIRPRIVAECDSDGLAIPQVYFFGNSVTFGDTHILVATNTNNLDTGSINKRLQQNIAFHEVIHPMQSHASKPLLPWSDLEDEAYEVERTLGAASEIPGFPKTPHVFFYIPYLSEQEAYKLTEAWRQGEYDFGEINVEDLVLAR